MIRLIRLITSWARAVVSSLNFAAELASCCFSAARSDHYEQININKY
jgi:hypothetical protein